MKKFIQALFVTAVVVIPMIAAADYIRKPTQLLDNPSRDANEMKPLEVGSQVEVNDKQGLWVSVDVDGESGWVRRLHVSEALPGAEGSSGRSLAGLVTGRQGSGNVVATSAARGLDAEELRSAAFDEDELEEMLALEVSDRKARRFADGMEEDNE